MTKKNIVEINNEIDLRDIAVRLWEGKWLVIAFVIASLLFSSIYILMEEKVFASEIRYKKINLMTSYDNNLKEIFYKDDYFNEWQEKSKNDLISYSDLSRNFIYQGRPYIKNEAELEFFIDEDAQKILLRSTDLDGQKISAYLDYLNFLNTIIKKNIEEELVFKISVLAEPQFEAQENYISTNFLNQEITKIKSDLNYLKNKNIYQFSAPKFPYLVKPRKLLIQVSGATLGFFLGVLMVLFRGISPTK